MAPDPADSRHVNAIRRFTRFYANRLGMLQEGLPGSTLSPTEARLLLELATRDRPTAAALGRDLGLDAGYLSRILKRFAGQGWIERTRSTQDTRQTRITLTPSGQAAAALLDQRSNEQVAGLLADLPGPDRARLVAALETVEALLGPQARPQAPYLLRPHRPGDMGWIVHRHGALYAQEYGWDETFEALVAEIAASFIKDFDPKRERCWIAEKDGDIVGSVLLVRQSDEVAKLRLLYVEPKARGLGIGKRFVEEAVRFARQAGYRRLTLWTNDVLHAARHLYARSGFRLVEAEPHRSFGQNLTAETWEMEL